MIAVLVEELGLVLGQFPVALSSGLGDGLAVRTDLDSHQRLVQFVGLAEEHDAVLAIHDAADIGRDAVVEGCTLVHDVVDILGQHNAVGLVGELKDLDALADAGEPLGEGLALLDAVVPGGDVVAHLQTLGIAVVVVAAHLALHPGIVVQHHEAVPVLVDHAVADALHRKNVENIVHHLLGFEAAISDLLQTAPLVGHATKGELVLLPHILPQFAFALLAVVVVVVQPSTQLGTVLVHAALHMIRDHILGVGPLTDMLAEPCVHTPLAESLEVQHLVGLKGDAANRGKRHPLDVLILGKALNRHAVIAREHVQPVACVHKTLADVAVALAAVTLGMVLDPTGKEREVHLHPSLGGDLGDLLVETLASGLELLPAATRMGGRRQKKRVAPRDVLEVAVAHLQFRVAVEPLGNGHIVEEARTIIEHEHDPAAVLARRDGGKANVLGLVPGGTRGDGVVDDGFHDLFL